MINITNAVIKGMPLQYNYRDTLHSLESHL